MTSNTISNSDDVIDVRDVIARVEELEIIRQHDREQESQNDRMGSGERDAIDAEYDLLYALLSDLKGNGGDEQWRGDWYPITLVRDSYFKDYAQELAEDCGMVDYSKLSWPLTCIDWEQAARELRMDYSSVEFDGVTYWYR